MRRVPLVVGNPSNSHAPTGVLRVHTLRKLSDSTLFLEGYPRPRLEWMLGTDLLPRGSSRYRLLEDGTVHTLLVSEATPKDAGQYTVRAVNPHGSSDSSARIDVVSHGSGSVHGDPAMFISRPETMITVAHGEDITVSFRLSGDPKPKGN